VHWPAFWYRNFIRPVDLKLVMDPYGQFNLAGWSYTRASIGTYVDAGGLVQTAAANIPRTEYLLGVPLGLLLEAATINRVLWNRDLTNGAWTPTTMTAALNQIGADGVVNSATLLTATGANATILQAIVHGNANCVGSAYIRRSVGAGEIDMTIDGGATWTALTLTSGYVRLSIPAQLIANLSVGFRIVTSGDAIVVDYVQAEDGTSANPARTSAIATTTAAVLRNSDSLTKTYAAPIVLPATALIRYVDRGAQVQGCGLFEIGLFATLPSWVGYCPSSTIIRAGYKNEPGVFVTSDAGNPSSIVSGDAITLRSVLRGDGSIQGSYSRNYGVEASGARSAANAVPASKVWGGSTIKINESDTGAPVGRMILQQFAIQPGELSLIQMLSR
jgi:hypothetical protein